MKRSKCLLFMLVLLSMQARLYAQDSAYIWEARKMQDRTYAEFNMNQFEIRHRHVVYLKNGNKMIIELSNLSDYKYIKDIGSILKGLNKDISFFRDSVSPDYAGNIRIDYTRSPGSDYHKMRFKKYDQNGDIYVSDNGEISKLKLEQDTISLKIFSGHDAKKWDWGTERYTNMRVTFLLNNYTDINQLLNDKDTLQHFIDTMALVSLSRQQDSSALGRILSKTTIIYRPYATYPNVPTAEQKFLRYMRFQYYDYERNNDVGPITFMKTYHSGLNININLGAGLVRNKVAPTFDLGPEYRNYWEKTKNDYTLFGLYISPYFLFDKGGDGKYRTHINWFINGEIGNGGRRQDLMGLEFKRFTLGIGYLLNPDGINFQRTTFKIFTNFSFVKGITIVPEIISTNDFHNFFPGLTLKVI